MDERKQLKVGKGEEERTKSHTGTSFFLASSPEHGMDTLWRTTSSVDNNERNRLINHVCLALCHVLAEIGNGQECGHHNEQTLFRCARKIMCKK